MNWSKIKNIIIFMLLALNVFIIANIGFNSYTSRALPDKTGENFRKVLENNHIHIDKDQIPSYYETRKKVDASFYTLDMLTEIFIGGRVTYTSDGQNVIASTGDKMLTVSGHSFEYTAGTTRREASGDKIIAALKKAGLSTYGAVYVKDERLVKVEIDSLLVEGVYLDVALDKEGNIAYAKGVWPIIEEAGTNEKVSVIGVTNKICEALPHNSTIEKIEKIYVTKSVGNDCEITPGWKIYADKKIYIIG